MQDDNEDILNLVFRYQQAGDLDERLKLAEPIAQIVGPPLKAYLLKRCPEHFDDVFSATLEGVFKSIPRFRGKERRLFWSFCYRIAENKIKDKLRRTALDNHRFVPLDADELWSQLEAAPANAEMSADNRMDYPYLISLLKKSKPDCYDFLYKRYALQWEYKLIAESHGLLTPTARIRTDRCLEHAQTLLAKHI